MPGGNAGSRLALPQLPENRLQHLALGGHVGKLVHAGEQLDAPLMNQADAIGEMLGDVEDLLV